MAEKVMSRKKMEKKIREIEAEGCKHNQIKKPTNVIFNIFFGSAVIDLRHPVYFRHDYFHYGRGIADDERVPLYPGEIQLVCI